MRGEEHVRRLQNGDVGQTSATRHEGCVVVETVAPVIDGGRFPAKTVVGDEVHVAADAYTDGHHELRVVLRFRRPASAQWDERPMRRVGNDRWEGTFVCAELGAYEFQVRAWIDPVRTWSVGVRKKLEARQDVRSDLAEGAKLFLDVPPQDGSGDGRPFSDVARRLAAVSDVASFDSLVSERVLEAARIEVDATASAPFRVRAEPRRAAASAWYELFPRSAGPPGRYGTFRDVEERLDYIAKLGFDVLYLPPIHPIGTTNRKGKNNAPRASSEDVGSPWAIGNADGGHDAIDPQLGTLEDFRHLVRAAKDRGIDVALDIAFQCSPDHPYVREHPEWFRRRPDGSIHYAENPPKKYEDIYPFDYASPDADALWHEHLRVLRFWAEQGVRLFRVDNPHTKPFPMWEWLLEELRRDHPDALFLSEAFTRPKPMHRLAKLGFTHSYTYFTWRNNRDELTQYFEELSRPEVRAYFWPHLWPNTPDILTPFLQTGLRPAFAIRFLLASTLSANYGIYGPAFELGAHQPIREGSEEYRDSEKYELRAWDLDDPRSLAPLIAQVNYLRREHPVLLRDDRLRFHSTDNDQFLVYSKRTDDHGQVVLVVVNLDPSHRQTGWTDLDLAELGIHDDERFWARDLLGADRYEWRGRRNFVALDPERAPGHVFLIERDAAAGG